MAQTEPDSELEPLGSFGAGPLATHNSSTQCSLPFLWGLNSSTLKLYGHELKAYVVWSPLGHPLGACHYSGVHIGRDPWPALLAGGVFTGGYTPGRDRCRRVTFPSVGQDWVAAGVALYTAEAAKHQAPLPAR
eukprot:938418-Amphidinium_carterae.1